jgi:CubicO group peptidase (beta-lactamase class C family)
METERICSNCRKPSRIDQPFTKLFNNRPTVFSTINPQPQLNQPHQLVRLSIILLWFTAQLTGTKSLPSGTKEFMKGLTYSALIATVLLVSSCRSCADDTTIGNSEIKAILRERVSPAGKIPGIVVGILADTGSRIISAGKLSRTNAGMVDGDTVFEIGSATKVFTALLLADMVVRGEIKLDDPISQYLPKSVKVPERNGRTITLLDLATHTSGLPRMPDHFAPKDPENPYADYTVQQLYAFLSGYTLTHDIGAEYEYSNLGGGLLGHILALRAGTNYEALVLQRICRPLGMTNTEIMLSAGMKSRLATGHNYAGQPVANWDIPTLAGAGALRSTANDLLKFLAANLNPTNSELGPAMQLTHTARHSAGSPDMDVGLCWHISKKYGAQVVWHNGGTGGYHSFMGFDPRKNRGVVVLANCARSIDDLGFHFLDSEYPLDHAQPTVAIALESKVLDRYVGRYAFVESPEVILTITASGGQLFVQPPGQLKVELLPKSETNFFLEVADAQATFWKDASGKVSHLVWHQNGDHEAKRLKAGDGGADR